jgi:AcrR family transcriptional regulator
MASAAARQSDDTPTTGTVDGRRARGERSKDAVVDAILALIREGDERPGAAEIAERAGVSMRSVFRHFDDLESLRAAAIERHTAAMLPLFHLDDPGGSVDDRVEALVGQRVRLYEEITPVRVVGERMKRQSPSIAEGLAAARVGLRDQVADLFAPELESLGPAERRDRLDAIEAATSWAVWHLLRTDQQLPIRRARAVMVLSTTALLTQLR